MKLKDILSLLQNIAIKNDISTPMIVGGIPRDKVLGIIKDEINDLDITTCDKTIHNLAKEFVITLSKNYNIKSHKMDDGHTSVNVGNLKVDFSSNFEVPNIDNILRKNYNIKNPDDIQREMFSRDFTANSLLLDFDLKTIKDPTKRGLADIKNRMLKTCLTPDITLRSNPNRIIRIIYLAAKLNFDVDKNIIDWVLKNKDVMLQSPKGYLAKNLDKALSKDADRAVHLITKMNLWDILPITDNLYPYYNKSIKKAQLRPNFDYGEGIFSKQYKSVSDFRNARRKKRLKKLKKIKKAEFTPITAPTVWESHFNDNNPPPEDFISFFRMMDELPDNMDRYENKNRDGSELSIENEKDEDHEDEELENIEKRRKNNKEENKPAFEQHPFYQSQYGYSGLEGTLEFPLEYYSGSISDEPGNQNINPYSNVYQSANINSDLFFKISIYENNIYINKHK